MKKLEQEIVNTIAEEAGRDKSEIRLDSDLYDLGIDSLSALELLAVFEDKYDIRISEDALSDTNSVREIARVISNELKKRREEDKRMKVENFYRRVFLIAGLYDVILGTMFFLFYIQIYNYLGAAPPSDPQYMQASTIFIILLGIMFFYVYANMYRNVDLVKVGALSKLAYSALVFYHYKFTGLPWILVLFAWCDLVFLVLFILFLHHAKTSGKIPISPSE